MFFYLSMPFCVPFLPVPFFLYFLPVPLLPRSDILGRGQLVTFPWIAAHISSNKLKTSSPSLYMHQTWIISSYLTVVIYHTWTWMWPSCTSLQPDLFIQFWNQTIFVVSDLHFIANSRTNQCCNLLCTHQHAVSTGLMIAFNNYCQFWSSLLIKNN